MKKTKKLYNLIKAKVLNVWNSTSHEGAIFKNMTKLFVGDGFARVISIFTAPIITRIYLPEHMGILSVFIALTTIMAPFATFRYSLAIPLPKNDSLAFNIATLSFILLTLTSFLITLVVYVFGSAILTFFSMEQITPFWYLIPIAVFGIGLYELLNNWAIRKKAFIPLAKTKVWQKTIGAITKIVLGIAGIKPLGLLLGQVFTQAGGLLSLFRSFKKDFKNNINFVKKKHILFLSKRYFDFPKYRVPSQFLLALTARSPLLFFAWHFDAETTGQIGLAFTMLSLPITLIGQTTGRAYYAEIATIGKKMPDKILKITKNVTTKLLIFSIIPFSIIFLFGPLLFQVVFGEVWNEAGVYARILSIFLIAQFVYSPISEGVINVFEKQSLVLILEILRLFLTFFVFATSYYFNWEPNYVLGLYSTILTFHYIISTIIIFRIIQKQIK